MKLKKKQLLTLEQSITLREEISEQERRFEKLLENKNLEIKQLTLAIEKLQNEQSRSPQKTLSENPEIIDSNDIDELASKIIQTQPLCTESA